MLSSVFVLPLAASAESAAEAPVAAPAASTTEEPMFGDYQSKGFLSDYSKWKYTKQAMDDWAQLLRKRLDEAHGKTADK